jgi:hypothetical protein
MKKILDMGWCIALMLLYSCSCNNQQPAVVHDHSQDAVIEAKVDSLKASLQKNRIALTYCVLNCTTLK